MNTAPVSINEGITIRAMEDKFVIKDYDQFDDVSHITSIYTKEDALALAAALIQWANK